MLSKTTRYSRHTYGDNGVFGKRNIVSTSFSATDLGKASAADTDALLNDVTAGTTAVTADIAIPRTITATASAGTGTVTINGTNVEGATISEALTIADTSTEETTKAFASVTSVVVGSGITTDIGLGAGFGINQRTGSTSSVKVLVIDGSTATLEDAATSTLDASTVEDNIVTLTTAANGSRQFRLYVLNYNWHVDPTNGNPSYGV